MARRIAIALALLSAAGPAAAQDARDASPYDEDPGEIDEVDEEEVVRAPRLRKESAEVQVRTEDARRVPGTQGDSLKVAQSLPGVARAAFGSGQLVVWGAAPRDTRVYVDGVEIPSLYHLGGLRSTINADLVRRIELVPGAFGPEYGRALGGLVEVETRALPAEGVHGYVGADLLDASAMLSAAIGGRLRAGAAARVSYVDRLLAGVVSPDIGDFYPIPRYHDAQVKATLALRRDEELSLVALRAADVYRKSLPSTDPAAVRAETTEAASHRVYLRYSRLLPDGASVVATPFFGVDEGLVDASFGGVPARLETSSLRYGLRMSHRGRAAAAATLITGVDLLGSISDVARAGSVTLPPREGDVYVFGQRPGDDVNADAWTARILDAGAHAAAEIALGPVTVTPGLRLDLFLIEASRLTPRIGKTPPIGASRLTPALDPRISIQLRAAPRLRYTLSGGLYHQPPEAEDLSAVFGNPTLDIARAIHASASQALMVTDTLRLELTAYSKWLDEIVMRSRLLSPPLARALNQNGEGRSYGVQMLLRQELWRGFFGWITYAISRSERKYDVDATWRLFDYDQPHVLGVVASQEVRGWVLGARLRYATGMPRTPVVGAYYDARRDEYQPIFGRQNEIRLPDFYQLDLRLEKSLELGPTTLLFFIDVQNVTARKNPEELAYSYDFSRQSTITGLPTLAVAGARLEY